MSKELFLCGKNPADFLVKLNKAKGMSLLSRNLKNTVPEKQANSIQISCFREDETKTIPKLRKLEYQTRNRFRTKLRLEIYCFVQKLQENIFQKQTMPTDCQVTVSKKQSPRNKLIPCKFLVLWKTQQNLFQNCANWKTRQETAFKTNCV